MFKVNNKDTKITKSKIGATAEIRWEMFVAKYSLPGKNNFIPTSLH